MSEVSHLVSPQQSSSVAIRWALPAQAQPNSTRSIIWAALHTRHSPSCLWHPPSNSKWHSALPPSPRTVEGIAQLLEGVWGHFPSQTLGNPSHQKLAPSSSHPTPLSSSPSSSAVFTSAAWGFGHLFFHPLSLSIFVPQLIQVGQILSSKRWFCSTFIWSNLKFCSFSEKHNSDNEQSPRTWIRVQVKPLRNSRQCSTRIPFLLCLMLKDPPLFFSYKQIGNNKTENAFFIL